MFLLARHSNSQIEKEKKNQKNGVDLQALDGCNINLFVYYQLIINLHMGYHRPHRIFCETQNVDPTTSLITFGLSIVYSLWFSPL